MAPKNRLAWIWLVFMIPIITTAWSQQTEPPKEGRQPDSKRSAWMHEVYLREASGYEFFLDEPKREKLELRRDPVMRWSSEGDYHGDVYVWTHHGSAAVVGCIFSGPVKGDSRGIMHEFHSLSPKPISAGEQNESKWHPTEAGITLEPIPEAPAPAENKVLRLAQMRELARRFTSQVDRQGGMSEMRLLTQPIYRYEITDGGEVTDGAVFAFIWSTGTDPEVLLVIESRRTPDGLKWHFAPARFTNREARLRYRGRDVWLADAATAGIFDGVTTKRYGAFSVKTVKEPDAPK